MKQPCFDKGAGGGEKAKTSKLLRIETGYFHVREKVIKPSPLLPCSQNRQIKCVTAYLYLHWDASNIATLRAVKTFLIPQTLD
ncbi:MAG TPA: hypothetical protein DEG17_10395 [Cyanobacteria bacterium UBA11149]|nr:hypothetical protein [Cyanobacteria bacterium UBA11366]HBK66856.1 hypothetical protein [Cyanobacteria bacterium UBA11166]HBR76682.1 hypothetical protein [Cyanobacteria bacterium UBA11159]HBS69835.1 hypothetical protein [Cyanobacteria bacterium UBA11153]HBW89258.1 hypothetical protein [Cyanobacteria bacterium UBA11149]